jgi:hypothetical protein
MMTRDADEPHPEPLNCGKPLVLHDDDDAAFGNAASNVAAGHNNNCAITPSRPPQDSNEALSNSFLTNQRSSKRLHWSDTELKTIRSEVDQDKDESANDTVTPSHYEDNEHNEELKRRHKELLRKAKLERLQERQRRESAAMFNYSRSDYPVREWQFTLPFGIQHAVVINPLVTGVSIAWLWGLVIGSAGTFTCKDFAVAVVVCLCSEIN